MYPNWELCVSVIGRDERVVGILHNYGRRIKVNFLPETSGISDGLNHALSLAEGEYVALLGQNDIVSPDALYCAVRLLQSHPEADVIYSDEDKMDESGELYGVFFKPDWSPDLFLSTMYLGRLLILRRSIVEEVGGFREGFEGAEDYDLILRIIERTSNIHHIPRVLYHRRGIASLHEAGKRAIEEYLSRKGIEADVFEHPRYRCAYRVKYRVKGNPLVSIIIPTRDNGKILKRCIESIRNKTSYPHYEIVIIDHKSTEEAVSYIKKIERESNVRVVRYEGHFNHSKMCNLGASVSRGDFLLFLNNDVEVITSEYLEEMLGHAQRKEVGAVGAKLLYPDHTLQHAGIILGLGGVAGHSHKHFPDDHPGYFYFPHLIRNYSAVTGACMMLRRSVFEEVGGFDEVNLPTTFNDVDLCLRICEKGYRIVYTPFAVLYHYEGATRGEVVEPEAIEFMRRKWKDVLMNDPFYNPNLTLSEENFSLRIRQYNPVRLLKVLKYKLYMEWYPRLIQIVKGVQREK